MDCPCGRIDAKARAIVFAQCCGRFIGHFDATPAPDAESLMRSRYSAFVLRDEAYLLATWHASRRPSRVQFDPATKWLGLDVRLHRQVDADHAEVEFLARSRTGGKAQRLQERSRFRRETDGRWYYLDGDLG